MHRPVLITAPAILPVSLAEAKLHLRVDHSEEDTLIEGLIRAATGHLDGWTGILGRCLVEQTWRQDYDAFRSCLPLPLGPVLAINEVTIDGEVLALSSYGLVTDAGGRSTVEFDGVSASGAVSIIYKAGYLAIAEVPAVEPGPGDPPDPPGSPAIPARSMVPAAIKAAIMLLVGAWYENREETAIGVSVAGLPGSVAVGALIAPYRRVGV